LLMQTTKCLCGKCGPCIAAATWKDCVMVPDPYPHAICTAHGTKRYCSNHLRAACPPDAAMKWLRKRCPEGDGQRHTCNIEYRAGVQVGLGRGAC
jgi:hypothetical protein